MPLFDLIIYFEFSRPKEDLTKNRMEIVCTCIGNYHYYIAAAIVYEYRYSGLFLELLTDITTLLVQSIHMSICILINSINCH